MCTLVSWTHLIHAIPAFSSGNSSRTWDDPDSVWKAVKKRPPNTMIGTEMYRLSLEFSASFGFDLMSFLFFFLSSHGWQISWKHVSPACKHANFLEPRTTQNQSLHCHCRGPNMKLVSKSGFWQVNVANKEFKSDLWPPTCHLLTPESILSSSYTSEMALDQVIVTLDSINVRMCDATVAACTFWLKHFIKELTVASVTWVT